MRFSTHAGVPALHPRDCNKCGAISSTSVDAIDKVPVPFLHAAAARSHRRLKRRKRSVCFSAGIQCGRISNIQCDRLVPFSCRGRPKTKTFSERVNFTRAHHLISICAARAPSPCAMPGIPDPVADKFDPFCRLQKPGRQHFRNTFSQLQTSAETSSVCRLPLFRERENILENPDSARPISSRVYR